MEQEYIFTDSAFVKLLAASKENSYVDIRREQEEQDEEEVAAQKAQKQWDEALPANADHPYLVAKGIEPGMLRIDKNDKNKLLVPVILDKKIRSLQEIKPGIDKPFEKCFTFNSRIKGCYYSIGKPEGIICICEGVATGFSIHKATGYAVVIAFSCGNLSAVSLHIRSKLPGALILLCSDNYARGREEAIKAAELVNGKVVLAVFDELGTEKDKDFNDMAKLYGLDQVKAIIDAACVTPEITHLQEDWPEFIPLGSHNLPRLNLDHLPGWLSDFVRAVSKATCTPPELAAGLALAVCATATARSFKILVKPGYYEPSNLWVIVALESGNRKSAVQSAVTKPLDTWERKQAKLIEPEIQRLTSKRKTMEALIKEKRNQAARAKDSTTAIAKGLFKEAADLEAALPNIPTYPQLWLSDTTPEELASQLKNNDERMAWLSSEGGMFDLLAGRYSKGEPNLDLMLKSHPGDSEKITRKSSKPIFLYNPLVTVGLSPQPSVLSGLASNKGFRGRGLLGRCLYLIPPSPLGYRTSNNKAVSDNISNEYSEAIQAMLNWKPAINKETGEKEHHIVKFSNEASSKYDDFFQVIELEMQPGGKLNHFKDWGGKAPGAAVRLAGGMHGSMYPYGEPWEKEVSGKTMDDAVAITTVMMHHSLAALDMMGADPLIDSARKIVDWIKDRKLMSFTISEAFNALRSRFQYVNKVKQVLEVLKERGYVKIDEPPVKNGPGHRGSPLVRVNPKVYE